MKKQYYVYYRDDGTIGRIAKFEDNLFYGYEKGDWVEMPGLIKIHFDITDYEEIDENEVEELKKEYDEQKV